MKAIVILHSGAPDVLQIMQRPVPDLMAAEVLIKVMAAGINRPDIAQRKGSYPAPPGAIADIPGLEVAGIIEQCGESVTRWKSGDSVCALLAAGGYAEYVVRGSPGNTGEFRSGLAIILIKCFSYVFLLQLKPLTC